MDIVSGINDGYVGQGMVVTGFSGLAFQIVGDVYCNHTMNALEEKCQPDICSPLCKTAPSQLLKHCCYL